MICGTFKQLQECGRGENYIADVLLHGNVIGDDVCIDEAKLERIRQRHGVSRRPGLGDRLASLLTRLGINPWPGCNCAGRKKWLNEFGRRLGL